MNIDVPNFTNLLSNVGFSIFGACPVQVQGKGTKSRDILCSAALVYNYFNHFFSCESPNIMEVQYLL